MSMLREIEGKQKAKWKSLAKMFLNVESYLNWVADSSADINKSLTEHSDTEKKLLTSIIAHILKKTKNNSSNFERFIKVAGTKLADIKTEVPSALQHRSGNEYVFRLQLMRYRPGNWEIGEQLVACTAQEAPAGYAFMVLHDQLTTQERETMRRQAKPLLDDATDHISPDRVTKWLVPALQKTLLEINDSIILKHAIRLVLSHGSDGFFVIISCLPDTTDKQKIVTLKLEFQLSIDVHDFPYFFKIPHPFPNTSKYKNHGKELIQDLIVAFAKGRRRIYVSSPLIKQKPKDDGEKIYLSRREKSVMEFIHKEVYGVGSKQKYVDPRAWKVEFRPLEKAIHKRIESDPHFGVVKSALAVYETLAQSGNKVVPPINQRTRSALKLWLFKHTVGKGASLTDTFKYLLMMTNSCLDDKFCPAFAQPKVRFTYILR